MLLAVQRPKRAVNAVVTDSKGCVGEAEQVISLATTIPVTARHAAFLCRRGCPSVAGCAAGIWTLEWRDGQ